MNELKQKSKNFLPYFCISIVFLSLAVIDGIYLIATNKVGHYNGSDYESYGEFPIFNFIIGLFIIILAVAALILFIFSVKSEDVTSRKSWSLFSLAINIVAFISIVVLIPIAFVFQMSVPNGGIIFSFVLLGLLQVALLTLNIIEFYRLNNQNEELELHGQRPYNSIFSSTKNKKAEAAFSFMLVSCILMSPLIIPLAGMIPMVLMYKKRVYKYAQSNVVLTVCTLLFGGLPLYTLPAVILLATCKKEEY